MKRRIISIILVLCLVWGAIAPQLSTIQVDASDEVNVNDEHIIELNGQNLFFCNDTATTSTITLKYTVESAEVGGGNTGVVATTDYLSPFPYDKNGSMKYQWNSNQVMTAGCTYTWRIGLGNDGFVNYEGFYIEDGSTEEIPIDLSSEPVNSKSLTDVPHYLGIYIAGVTTAKLYDVTCVDENGNDLGIQINHEESKINGNAPRYISISENSPKYDVDLNRTSQLFLGNAEELSTNGPVIIRYTVDSVAEESATSYMGGVIATNWPANDYPYRDGSVDYANGSNLFEEGFTYTFVIELDSTNEVMYTGRAINAEGVERDFKFTETIVNVAEQRKHYGIWADGTVTASLKNVVCVDAEGKDLGIIINDKNLDKCVIQKQVIQGGVPVELNGANLFLSNKLATTSGITLQYTVESANVAEANAGVVATTDYLSPYPYDGNGSLAYKYGENRVVKTGRTYTWDIELGADGYVTYQGFYTEGESTEPVEVALTSTPVNTKSLTGIPCYFGIYVAGETTAKLTNVICIDKAGNNLGVQVNNEHSKVNENTPDYISIPKNSTKYNVNLNGTSQLFLGNREELSTNGPVIIRYTVDKVNEGSATAYTGGVIGTNWPANDYPYRDGSLDYSSSANLFEEGFTYTFIIQLDSNNEVIYAGRAVDSTGRERHFKFTDTIVNVATQRKHYGIWADGTVTASLKNVVCVDSQGKDLGLVVNDNNASKCVIREEAVAVGNTVELNGTNLYLSNATATTGKVVLQYTVDSAAVGGGNTGVVATTDYLSPHPYVGNGSMQYQWNSNQVMTASRTYTWELGLGSEGYVVYSGSYTENGNGEPVEIAMTSEPVNSRSLTGIPCHFGIYIAGTTTALLTNVSCKDENGVDLGLQVNNEKCKINGNKPQYATLAENATKKTFDIYTSNNVFLSNEEPTSGPVVLQYTVKDVGPTTTASGQCGAVASADRMLLYPYLDGSIICKHTGTLFESGFTYTFVIGMGNDNKVTYTGRAVNAEGSERAFAFTSDSGDGNAESKYFGIWATGLSDVVLENVSCVDLNGNDLGVVNHQEERIEYTWIKDVEEPTDYDYSFAVIGDTQIVNRWFPDELADIYDFIVDNASKKKIKFALGLGDITDKDVDREWLTAQEQIGKLDNVVPYSLVRGNHDSTEQFLKYFGDDSTYENQNFLSYGDNINTAHKFAVGKMNYLVLALDFRPSADVLAWANEVVEANPNHNVIVTTHSYLYADANLGSSDAYMWDEFIAKHENIVLVLSGHYSSDNVVIKQSEGVNKNMVTQLLIDPQEVDGDSPAGMVAMLYFSEDGSKVDVRYYSTVREEYLNESSQFSFTINTIERKINTDVNEDGKVNSQDEVELRRILAGISDITFHDVTGDDKCDVRDLVALVAHLENTSRAVSIDFIGGQDVMPIAGFMGPYVNTDSRYESPDFISDTYFDLIDKAGINLINYQPVYYNESSELVMESLDLAQKYGIGMFVSDANISNLTGKEVPTADALSVAMSAYLSHPACVGLHLVDEPDGTDYVKMNRGRYIADYGDIANVLQQDLNLLCYSNMLPVDNYAVDKENYEKYVDEFCETFNPKVLMWDYYVYDTYGTTEAYFWNMDLMRNKSEEYGIPFWSYVQAGGRWRNDDPYLNSSTYYPTEEQFNWNINTSLAFGAQGIQYFPLIQPQEFVYKNSKVGDFKSNGMINAKGELNQWYYYAQNINKHIAAIDEVLMNSVNKGIIVSGEQATEDVKLTTCVLEDGGFRQLKAVSGDAMVGCFNYNGKTALYVVNYSREVAQNITLGFDSKCNIRMVQEANTSNVDVDSLTLNMDAGEGVLLVIE